MILPLILLVVSLKYFVFVALGSLWYTILYLLFFLLFTFYISPLYVPARCYPCHIAAVPFLAIFPCFVLFRQS